MPPLARAFDDTSEILGSVTNDRNTRVNCSLEEATTDHFIFERSGSPVKEFEGRSNEANHSLVDMVGGNYRIMDMLMREYSLQECLKAIDSDTGGIDEEISPINSASKHRLANTPSDKHQKEDRNKRDKFKKILSKEKSNGLTVPEEKSKETYSSNSNDERLSLECGISEKESKFRFFLISKRFNTSFIVSEISKISII